MSVQIESMGAVSQKTIKASGRQDISNGQTFTPEKDGIFILTSGDGSAQLKFFGDYWARVCRGSSGWIVMTVPALAGIQYTAACSGGSVQYYPYEEG